MQEFVECPICGRKLKEINTAHLIKHGIKIDEFILMFPGVQRTSDLTRKKRDTMTDISDEIRQKIRKAHGLDGYIEKYGESVGTEIFNNIRNNKKIGNTLDGYIEKYGEIDGNMKYLMDKKNKGITLEKYIGKYGKISGTEKYDTWRKNVSYCKTVDYYIGKYGKSEGLSIFIDKHRKANEKKRKIPIDMLSDFDLYSNIVKKITNISIRSNKLKNIELRSREYHLDHIISKEYGFINNIPPYIIGSIFNLSVIHASINCSKQGSSVDELIINEIIDKTIKQ
jgi:hypothetical protein